MQETNLFTHTCGIDTLEKHGLQSHILELWDDRNALACLIKPGLAFACATESTTIVCFDSSRGAPGYMAEARLRIEYAINNNPCLFSVFSRPPRPRFPPPLLDSLKSPLEPPAAAELPSARSKLDGPPELAEARFAAPLKLNAAELPSAADPSPDPATAAIFVSSDAKIGTEECY